MKKFSLILSFIIAFSGLLIYPGTVSAVPGSVPGLTVFTTWKAASFRVITGVL